MDLRGFIYVTSRGTYNEIPFPAPEGNSPKVLGQRSKGPSQGSVGPHTSSQGWGGQEGHSLGVGGEAGPPTPGGGIPGPKAWDWVLGKCPQTA